MKLTQRPWRGPRGLTYQSLLARGPAVPSEGGGPARVPLGARSAEPGSPAASAGTPLHWTLLMSARLHPSSLLPVRVKGAQAGQEHPLGPPDTSGEHTGICSAARHCQSGSCPFGHAPTHSFLVKPEGHSSFCVGHLSKGHTLTCRQQTGSSPGLPGLSTARATSTALPSRESSTNIQCGRIWRRRRICFTWRGRRAQLRLPSLKKRWGLSCKGLESFLPEASGVDRLGVKGGAKKLELGRSPLPNGSVFTEKTGNHSHQVLAHFQAQGAQELFLGSPNCERAPLPHAGRQRVVHAEARAQGPGPPAALAAPAAPGPAAGGWECGCTLQGSAVAVPQDSCPDGVPAKEERSRPQIFPLKPRDTGCGLGLLVIGRNPVGA